MRRRIAAGMILCLYLFGLPGVSVQRRLHAQNESTSTILRPVLGDYYYFKKEYNLARIEYERQMLQQRRRQEDASDASARLGLTLMRQDRFQESLWYLSNEDVFAHLYLRMYAAMRSGMIHRALVDQGSILSVRSPFSTEQKDQARLLGGALYLERADYEGAREYFTLLQRESESPEIQKKSGQVLTELEAFEELDRKSAILAGVFSAVLPGSGQIYSEHYADGTVAFFFNTMFLGSAAIMYDLERRADSGHAASAVFGIFGLMFYLSNIGGAYKSAERYNHYQERKFHQEIRDIFFNLDYVERTSGITFTETF
ncbi:MAG: hypothetical protein KDK30_01805 [Leptospiraceae bacterium]|nr:hypothetical protein [Leptospiraceae bacterium]